MTEQTPSDPTKGWPTWKKWAANIFVVLAIIFMLWSVSQSMTEMANDPNRPDGAEIMPGVPPAAEPEGQK